MKEQNVAQVTIQDNGPGIKQSDIHRLFQPFFSTKPDGIGMGLSISRSLIEANGGQLWIDPDEGPGATFHLTIPFAP
jgi:two-component system sensor kinase FixL